MNLSFNQYTSILKEKMDKKSIDPENYQYFLKGDISGIQDLRMNEHHPRMLAPAKAYKIFNWLPLKDTSYQAWKECRILVESVQLLKRMLAVHIIALLASMEWRLPDRVKTSLQHRKIIDKLIISDRLLLITIKFAIFSSLSINTTT